MTARLITAAFMMSACFLKAQDAAALSKSLSATYDGWRNAIIAKDARQWQLLTSVQRQAEVRNRLISEKRAFPAGVFELPAPPPPLTGLKCIHVSQRGSTAKAAYYGKINFGVGGAPPDNILLVSFTAEGGRWKYDKADFVNLAALPDVRKELNKNDLSYLKETPEFQATGVVPPKPPAVAPAKYIAKIYVFCPGREVQAQVNRVSRHRFANAKEAEIVLGGAKDGPNDVAFRVTPLEGGTGKEALAIRVYLMSEIEGTKPIMAYEYKVEEGGPVKNFDSGRFVVDPATAAKLLPK